MAKQTQDIIVRIKVDDGQAKVQIDQLGGGFMRAQKAAEAFQEAIKRQDPILKGSVADYRRQIKALKEIRDNSAKTAADYKRQTAAIEQLQVKMRGLTETTMTQNKVNEDQISNAGLAGATLTEFGRTISDLPFGITAITNNLSQLATLMVTLMAKTGGTTKAFKLLGRQLKGPLGIIILFQVLIAAVQKLFGGMSKADEAVKSFSNTLNEQAAALTFAQRALTKLNLSAEQNQEIVDTLNSTFESLNLELDKFGGLTQKATDDLDAFIKGEAKKALIKSLMQDLIDKEVELLKEKTKATVFQKDEVSTVQTFFNKVGELARKAGDMIRGPFMKESTKAAKKADELSGEINKMSSILNSPDLVKGIIDFFGSIEDGSSDARDKVKPLVNDLSSLFDKMSDKELMLTIEAMFKGLSVDELKLQKSAIEELGSNATNALKGLRKLAKKNNNEQKDFLKTQKEQADALKRAIDSLLGAYETFKQAGDLLFEAEISREERKTVLINNQLRKRLDNEKYTVKQRDALNNQISANEENLARKRDKIAEKQFKIQKAVAMGEAIITAFISASRAREAVLAGPEKFLGIAALPLSKIAYGIVLASGLATAAAISRQQFVPSAIGGGGGAGGAGGGASIQAPDFNVVGASAQSQLATTVAGQQARPVKAFVVGKDISTQQELDRNISNTASFG
jgi:hypothetical protein